MKRKELTALRKSSIFFNKSTFFIVAFQCMNLSAKPAASPTDHSTPTLCLSLLMLFAMRLRKPLQATALKAMTMVNEKAACRCGNHQAMSTVKMPLRWCARSMSCLAVIALSWGACWSTKSQFLAQLKTWLVTWHALTHTRVGPSQVVISELASRNVCFGTTPTNSSSVSSSHASSTMRSKSQRAAPPRHAVMRLGPERMAAGILVDFSQSQPGLSGPVFLSALRMGFICRGAVISQISLGETGPGEHAILKTWTWSQGVNVTSTGNAPNWATHGPSRPVPGRVFPGSSPTLTTRASAGSRRPHGPPASSASRDGISPSK
mmetsp:Transcript_56791/g.169062  ORF Transcript_56791/g.169062 Transcript_56791/m.169062 type:complete len:320 (-) Transcript_56791:992-1951(-)